jgi:hypothetical protein
MAWTAPRTWVAGEVPSASTFNTHVRDNLKAIGDAWTAYTPTLTNWTLGNGTLTGSYVQAGKLTFAKVFLTLGTTTTPSGNLVISIPFTKVADDGINTSMGGTAVLLDTSVPTTNVLFPVHSATGSVRFISTAGATATATSPWTWATGDKLNAEFWYESA